MQEIYESSIISRELFGRQPMQKTTPDITRKVSLEKKLLEEAVAYFGVSFEVCVCGSSKTLEI